MCWGIYVTPVGRGEGSLTFVRRGSDEDGDRPCLEGLVVSKGLWVVTRRAQNEGSIGEQVNIVFVGMLMVRHDFPAIRVVRHLVLDRYIVCEDVSYRSRGCVRKLKRSVMDRTSFVSPMSQRRSIGYGGVYM